MRCVRGAICDVIVDLRAGSPTRLRVVRRRAERRGRQRALRPRGLRARLPDARRRHRRLLSHGRVLPGRGGARACAGTIRAFGDRAGRARRRVDLRARRDLPRLRPETLRWLSPAAERAIWRASSYALDRGAVSRSAAASPATACAQTLRHRCGAHARRSRSHEVPSGHAGARLDGAARVEHPRRLDRGRAAASASSTSARRNLHVVNYSVPVRARMSLDELRPHLPHAARPARPDPVPDLVLRGELGLLPDASASSTRCPTASTKSASTRRLAPGHLTYGELRAARARPRTRS